MSVQAMSWALTQQIVTAAPARHVLLCLANYADQDGKAAFPSAKTLAKDTGLGERTVRYKLDELESAGVIVRGNQKITAAYIDRSDRRPVCYDIVMERGAGDAGREERGAAQDATGCSSDTNGVQLMQERGAGDAPNPSFKPSSNPPLTQGGENDGLPEWLPAQQWADFVEHRKHLKAKLSDVATKKLINKLDALRKEGNDPAAVLDQSVVNDWKGVFPLKLANNVHAFPGKPRPKHSGLDQANDTGLRQRADGAYSL